MIVQSMPYPTGLGADAPYDYFANNGATAGFVAQASVPQSFYDATGDKTWVAWEGWNGSRRAVYVQCYDHANNRWGKRYLVSTDTLTDDSHGAPTIVMDHEGYVHCFFGAHASEIKYSVTNAARDPSAWTQKAGIGTDLSYPHAILIGSALYLFARGGSLESLIRYKTSALSGGAATWGSPQTVVTFGGGRFYPGDAFAVGTKIHIVANYADAADTFRRDIYHFVYDTGDEGVENSTNGVNTAVGSQPISLATANASYIVVNQTTNNTSGHGLCRTSNGDLHLAYIDDTASPYDINYINFNGSSWSSPALVTTLVTDPPPFGDIASLLLLARADDSLELWYPTDPGAAYTSPSGLMTRVIRSTGGSWGSPSTVLTPSGADGFAQPTGVLNHDESLFAMFGENAGSALDADAGGLKLYAYGSGGFVTMGPPVFTSVPAIASSVPGFYGDGDTLSVAFDHTGTSETYQWNADGVAIGGATSPTYVLSAGDVGDTISVTVTASNLAGSANATSAGVGPIVTPTFTTHTRVTSAGDVRVTSAGDTRVTNTRTA